MRVAVRPDPGGARREDRDKAGRPAHAVSARPGPAGVGPPGIGVPPAGAGVCVLGSGTLLPDDRRRSAAHLVRGSGALLLMDCGPGTVHGFDRHGVAWREITHLALTHFHVDHVGDVTALLFAYAHGLAHPRRAPLTVIGPVGVAHLLDALAAAHGDFVRDPGFPVEVVELDPGTTYHAAEWSLTCTRTAHTPESVAYRWEGGEGRVGYTGDTGPHPGLGGFFREVDVLICECGQPDPPTLQGHLSPAGVATLAGASSPARVVLTHVFPPMEPGDAADAVRGAGYDGAVIPATDGLWLPLGAPA